MRNAGKSKMSYSAIINKKLSCRRDRKAVTRIFFRGCHVKLERHRREDRGAVGAERDGVWGGGVPLPRKFLHFLFQNGEFLYMPAWISVW